MFFLAFHFYAHCDFAVQPLSPPCTSATQGYLLDLPVRAILCSVIGHTQHPVVGIQFSAYYVFIYALHNYVLFRSLWTHFSLFEDHAQQCDSTLLQPLLSSVLI